MRKDRGFKLGHKMLKICYQRLKDPNCSTKPMSKLKNWIRFVKNEGKGLCFSRPGPGYFRVGLDLVKTGFTSGVPKGHLAVYVGEREEDTCSVLVPVIYFNHPLFGDLLRLSEKVYGFDHPGRIQIPCQISEFEKVQNRIASADDGGDSRRRRIVVM